MLDALNITEEEALGLAELARHDLALARDFARRAQAAEDGDEASRLARSYQRAARSYRQTLALKARLKRDLAQAGAAAAQAQANTPRPKPGGAAVARRIGEVRAALLRLAWDEAERPEEERVETPDTEDAESAIELFAFLRTDVEATVAEDSRKDSFCDEPLDDHVARLAMGLGFPADAIGRWRDLPDPPQAAMELEPDEEEPVWRSSA